MMVDSRVTTQLEDLLASRHEGGLQQQLWVRLGSADSFEATFPNSVRQLTRFPAWCSTKPVVCLVWAELLGSKGIGLDTPLREVLPRHLPVNSDVQVADVMAHDSGLADPSMIDAMLASKSVRRMRAAESIRQARRQAVYSEYAMTVAACESIAHLSGTATVVILSSSLSNWGLREIDFSGSSDGLGPSLWQSVSLTADNRALHSHQSWDLACGGTASARGLGEFLSKVALGSDCSELQEVATKTFAFRRKRAADPVFKRTCTFGGGFALQLEDHGFGPLSSDSIGCVGAFGSRWACADGDLVISYGSNLNNGNADFIDAQRQELIRDVRSALEIGP